MTSWNSWRLLGPVRHQQVSSLCERGGTIVRPSGSHIDVTAGCDPTEGPRAGRTKAARGAERVLHELHVADLVGRHLDEQAEGRGNLLAERTRFVRKAPEHRDTVFVHDYVSNLERLCLPHSADAVEGVDDALWAAVRSRPGKHLVQLRIVEVQRYIGNVLAGETAHVFDACRVREQFLYQFKRGGHLYLRGGRSFRISVGVEPYKTIAASSR